MPVTVGKTRALDIMRSHPVCAEAVAIGNDAKHHRGGTHRGHVERRTTPSNLLGEIPR